MGCCSMCQLDAPATSNNIAAPLSLDPSTSDVQVNLPDTFTDPYALELESYTRELMDTQDWTVADEQAHVTIRTLNRSKYSDQSPVIHLQIMLGEPVNAAVAEALLLNPDARKVWDTRLSDFYQVMDGPKQVFYTRLCFPFPFKNRDFVEVVTRFKRGSETCIVMYSSEEHEMQTKHERGRTHFTVIRIAGAEKVSEISIVSQFDLNLVFSQQVLAKYIASIMGEWTKALVQMVLLNQGK